MQYIHVSARLTLLTMLALIAFLAGCSRSHVPVPEKPTAYTQERTQAVEHWRDIAVDVAEKIRNALVERDDLLMKPLYVSPPNSRPFMLTFQQLLKTELVSRGIQVAESREPGSVDVDYDVLTVVHDPSRFSQGYYSAFADMGVAVGRFFSGNPKTSDHEIVVNVRMAYNNRYVTHLSYIRYINDADWDLYISPESLDPVSGQNRVIRVTNR